MKKVLITLGVFILLLGGGLFWMYSMVTSNDIGEDLIGKSTLKTEEVDLLISSLKKGEEAEPVEMDSQEFNALTNKISEEIEVGNGVDIESINTKVENGKLHVQIPAEVKGQKVILSAKTDVKVEDGKIKIKVENLKSGKLDLPESAIGDKINELIGDDKFKIDNNEISIDLESIPYNIENIKIDGDKLIINE